jgi:hypothetical protein
MGKAIFAEMRESGVRGLLVYCADYWCSHSIAISGDGWPDEIRLSDVEARFVCRGCGKRRASGRRNGLYRSCWAVPSPK